MPWQLQQHALYNSSMQRRTIFMCKKGSVYIENQDLMQSKLIDSVHMYVLSLAIAVPQCGQIRTVAISCAVHQQQSLHLSAFWSSTLIACHFDYDAV